MSKLREQLKRHEGLRLKPYRCTAGKLTIGYGRNIEEVGISREEAGMLLDNDIAHISAELTRRLPWLAQIDPVRRDVLVNMAFMGVGKLLDFKKLLAAVFEGRHGDAKREMLNSLWARQVGSRAIELAEQMLTGKYREDV